jgi:guanylate cyclase
MVYFLGYEEMIQATGRYFCDFLQSIDNIHVQMKFIYRRMKSPTMQVTEIDDHGAVLIYRSDRSGFQRYLMGKRICFGGYLFSLLDNT